MKNNLTDEKFWDHLWNVHIRSATTLRPFLFTELLEGLEYSTDKSMIELGCVPGDNLVQLHKILGYKVNGIDYSNVTKDVTGRMEAHGIKDAKIINADIFSFKFEKQYDLVFSVGLVEHFKDPLPILQKHVEILKPEGRLLIAFPNFRYFHYITRYIADYDCLMAHNTLLMSVKRLQKYVDKLDINTDYCDYYGDFAFWMENQNQDISTRLKKKLVWTTARLVKKLFNHRPLQGRTTFFFSPWVVIAGTKRRHPLTSNI